MADEESEEGGVKNASDYYVTWEAPNVVVLDSWRRPVGAKQDKIISCKECSNKSFVCTMEDGQEWPQMYCSVCGLYIGAWAWLPAYDKPS